MRARGKLVAGIGLLVVAVIVLCWTFLPTRKFPEYAPSSKSEERSRWEPRSKVASGRGHASKTVRTLPAGDLLRTAQFLADAWDEIGVDVTIETVGENPFVVSMVTGRYEVAVLPLFNAPDPGADAHFYRTGAAERDNAADNLGYSYEAISGYVWTAP